MAPLSRQGPRAMAALVLVLMPVSIPTNVGAQSVDTLRIEEVVEEVRSANPMLRAMRLRAQAGAERVPQAGALPDPVLSLGLMNRPVDNFGPDQAMTMNNVQWSQRLPWPGTRGFQRERESRLAESEALDADEMESALIARAKTAYYRRAQMDRAIQIMDRTRSLLRDHQEVSTARYAVGAGLQQDILQAQVAVARLTVDIESVEQGRIAEVARLNALMGREASQPLGLPVLDAPGEALPPIDQLIARAAQRRPALQSAQRRVSAAAAGVRAAERQSYPDVTVTLGYAQRPRFDDLATLAVGMTVPIWAGSRQRPRQRERQAVMAMEEARALDLYNETYADLAELRAKGERTRSLMDLYRTSIMPQARAAVESALSAYRVGQVDYMTLLSNQMNVNRFEIELLQLAADYQAALAEIEALTGSLQGEGP